LQGRIKPRRPLRPWGRLGHAQSMRIWKLLKRKYWSLTTTPRLPDWWDDIWRMEGSGFLRHRMAGWPSQWR
jgi:hypothetical protein